MLDALNGQIKPVRAGLAYRAGLLLVAVTMLVLGLIYLSLIGGVCYLLYLHLTRVVPLLGEAGDGRGSLLLVIGPVIPGVLLLIFLIKPLLARRVNDSVPLTLRSSEEPLLFDFFYRLCRAVGAPPPMRIDVDLQVNASAGFRSGWHGLVRKELVLTFGLPLVACLDTRQFAGVLAHEMGHFAQGSATRLTFVIRFMNAWFARIVYRRDHWDLALIRLSRRRSHPVIQLIAWLARFLVWLTRRILWCLMWAGHAASSLMSRQMEYDADRYECRLVGSTTARQMFERLRCIDVAAAAAFSDLNNAWREQRLHDDFPALICSRETQMPEAVRKKLREAEGRKTRWFDSHPCHADRVAAVDRENAPGLFDVQLPASVLFSNFAELSRIATMLFYKQQIGRAFNPSKLVKTEALVESSDKQAKTYDAMRQFFLDLIDATRPVFPDAIPEPPTDVGKAAERLLELRSRLIQAQPSARNVATRFDESQKKAFTFSLAKELRTAGFRKSGIKDDSPDAMSDDALAATQLAAARDQAAASRAIQPVLAIAMQRLELALSFTRSAAAKAAARELPETDDFGEYELAEAPSFGSGDVVLDALIAMRRGATEIENLWQHHLALRILLPRLRPAENPKTLTDAIIWHSRKASGLLREVHEHLRGPHYPYADDQQLSLSRYVVPAMPPPDEVGKVTSAAEVTVEAYRRLYLRLMADLAQRAQQVESDLGLPPMELPPQQEASARGATSEPLDVQGT